MTKRMKHEKGNSTPSEKVLRSRYREEVRKFKEWCSDHDISYYTYDYAESTYICVMSRDEYLLHEIRRNISEDDECYFLSPTDYETWCEEVEEE